jgi:metal-dependent hydrolase (beta-lactamase superfamily II)
MGLSITPMGLTPADIGSVVITHAHWDHVLGLAALEFPQAKIYIQRLAQESIFVLPSHDEAVFAQETYQ